MCSGDSIPEFAREILVTKGMNFDNNVGNPVKLESSSSSASSGTEAFVLSQQMIIIIACCAGVVFLMILVGVVYCVRQRRRKREIAEAVENPRQYYTNKNPFISKEEFIARKVTAEDIQNL